MAEHLSPKREAFFPNLARTAYHKTSEETEIYNCIAFAAGDETRWWQPPIFGFVQPGSYWPPGASDEWHIDSLIQAFQIHGFERCESPVFENGYAKIALYAYSDQRWAHAAKLLPNGHWSSKLGDFEDICDETLASLEGDSPAYGKVFCLMRRKELSAE